MISIAQARAMGIDVDNSTKVNIQQHKQVETRPAMPTLNGRPVQSLWMANWTPQSLNKMLGHHMKRARIKKEDRERIAFECLMQGIVHATTRMKVDILVVLPPGRRRIDKDNARKSLYDGLKHAGAIMGDSPNLLAEGRVSFARAEKLAGESPVFGTMIVLTNMVE